jgi:hypothetical protein
MGGVYEVWAKNMPGTLNDLLGQKLADLVDECGEPSVLYGIEAAIEANARHFRYIAACARNHAAGRQPPPRARPQGSAGGAPPSKVAASLSAIEQYEQLKARHGGNLGAKLGGTL